MKLLNNVVLLLATTTYAATSIEETDSNDLTLNKDSTDYGITYDYKANEVSSTTSTPSSTSSFSSCNPLKTTGCSPNPALATSISDDFKEESSNYVTYRYGSQIFYTDEGLELTLAERFDNPSLVSDFYIMFGKVEVWLKSANGTGVISSFYLQSDDLDEIDMEWFGGDASQMQSNFFSKGDTTTYDRGAYHNMSDPRTDYHNYTLEWTEESLTWYIDGTSVRVLQNDTSSGYPQTPMRLFFGIWAGGDESNSEGTIEWAGGLTDYSDAPFSMYINKLVVSDYSSGSEYSYSGTSGSWSSIVAKDGEVNGRVDEANQEFAVLVSGSQISESTSSAAQSVTANQNSQSTTTLDTKVTSSKSTTAATTTKTDSSNTTLTTKKTSSSTSSSAKSSVASVTTSNGANHISAELSGMLALVLVFFNLF